jgi:hypothetical protein
MVGRSRPTFVCPFLINLLVLNPHHCVLATFEACTKLLHMANLSIAQLMSDR